jgi:uncharacterized protein YcaQ
MAHDDWRIRIELPDQESSRGFLDRLGLTRHDAVELADELRAMANWLELDHVSIAPRGDLAGALARATDDGV